MANRTMLHRDKLNSFAAWLEWKGWEIEDSKSEWEALRARKPSQKENEHPLIVYDRVRGPCLTLQDRDIKVFKDFQKDMQALQRAHRAGRI